MAGKQKDAGTAKAAAAPAPTTTTATTAATTTTGTPATDAPSDPRIGKLLDEFLADLERQEPDPATVVGQTADGVKAIGAQLSKLFESVDGPVLDQQQIDKLAGKDHPDLLEIAELFAAGLKALPQVEAATLPAAALAQGASLGRAAGRFCKVGDLVSSAGENGTLLAVATADTLCDRANQQAEADRKDPATDADTRSDIGIAFSGPAGQLQAKVERQKRLKQKDLHAGRPLKAQLGAQEERAAATRLIDAFLANRKTPEQGGK